MSATLGEAYVNIIPKAPGISNQLSSMFDGAGNSAGSSCGTNIGKSLLSALGTVVTAAAVGNLIKSAFSEGGNIQQSFGGLTTIYGDAAASMQEYAQAAASYGVSANNYAEQAVSFGAALKSAFGGDTVAAAEAANTAIQDMADNAAKMGTDITSIQNAYQGFAKQNYTMLDNLKLGYGGTKEEMERLLSKAQEITGVEYNIDNLGDVYEAIHVIQGELDLTGTAASEAATTFTGALGSLQASWTNVLASITAGEMNLGTALGNLETSLGNFITVAMQMATQMASTLPSVLTSIANIITTNAPTVISGGMEIMAQLINGIMQAIPSLILAIPTVLTSLLTAIVANAPMLLQGAADMMLQLATGLQTAIPTLVAAIPTVISGLLQALITNGPSLISAGATLISSILTGLIQAYPTLLAQVPTLITQLVTALTTNATQLMTSGVQLALSLLDGLVQAAPQIAAAVPEIIMSLVTALLENVPQLVATALTLILGLASGLILAIPSLLDSLGTLIDEMDATFSNVDWASIGSNIIAGIVNGVKNAASSLLSSLQSLASQALQAAKNALGIASPSKLFMNEVGKWIPEGMAVGIEANVSSVNSAVGAMALSASDEFESAAAPGMTATGYTGTTATAAQTSPTTVTIEFAGSLAQLGRVLQPYIKQEGSRIGASYVSGGSYA